MTPDEVTARYRACVRARTHRAGPHARRVVRSWKGRDWEMPECDTCGVPIRPRTTTSSGGFTIRLPKGAGLVEW